MERPENQKPGPEELEIRFTDPEIDATFMNEWFHEPGILRWFPMEDDQEIEDSVQRWMSFSRLKASLTGMIDGEPCGICSLYLHPYKKIRHQCEFGIIVSPQHRGKGIGGDLLRNLLHLAKTRFKLELIHLQVYEENPAISLYERFGFTEFGRQKNWIKEDGRYRGRIFMERHI